MPPVDRGFEERKDWLKLASLKCVVHDERMLSASERYRFPADYFGTYEASVRSRDDFELRVAQVAALGSHSNLKFYWRGHADASWGVHSSLHRFVSQRRDVSIADVTDAQVVAVERQVVGEAREWIRPSVGARLATVDLLARLQHYGVPTRLLDFSKDPFVALFFAVSTQWDSDGRIIIAAARDSIDDGFKNSFDIPWARRQDTRPKGWSNTLVALADHEDFLRISRQKGVFLTGGTPSTGIARRLSDGYLIGAHHVRKTMSIPLALHSWVQAEAAMEGWTPRGRKPRMASALTLKVPSGSKRSMFRWLTDYDYSYESLFPDIGGFLVHSGLDLVRGDAEVVGGGRLAGDAARLSGISDLS